MHVFAGLDSSSRLRHLAQTERMPEHIASRGAPPAAGAAAVPGTGVLVLAGVLTVFPGARAVLGALPLVVFVVALLRIPHAPQACFHRHGHLLGQPPTFQVEVRGRPSTACPSGHSRPTVTKRNHLQAPVCRGVGAAFGVVIHLGGPGAPTHQPGPGAQPCAGTSGPGGSR